MRNFARMFILVAATLTNGVVVAAEDAGLTVAPAIDFGFKQSSMNISANGSPYTSAYKPSYITLIPSLSMTYGQFYGAVSYDTPLTEYHTSYGTSSATGIAYSDNTYSRQETTVALGYRLLPALSVFGGYLNGKSKMRSVDYSGVPLQPYPGDISFNTNGYFAGVSTSHSYGDKGAIALSVAYAQMNGTIDSKFSNVSGTIQSQNASGYSTNLSWSGPMGNSMFYRVGLRYAKYYYQFQSQASMKVEEPVQGLTFGVSKYF